MSEAEARIGGLRAAANIAVLALCQGVAMSASALVITVTAVVGSRLAPIPELSTLPLALQFLATMAATLPASLLMARIGRRAGFTLGAAAGVAGGLLGVQAILEAQFWLYCAASALVGVYIAHAFYHRFAAAETAPGGRGSRAIGLVMAGGVLAALLGPQLAAWSRDLFAPVMFAGGFLVIAGLAGVELVLVQLLQMPAPPAGAQAAGGSWRALLGRRSFLIAVLCAVVAYAAMNLVMTATPLAVLGCHMPFDAAAFVIQWHVFAMHAPSFVTGDLIRRIGVAPTMALGALLMAGCAGVNLSGVELPHFLSALILLGVGWNLLFVGATALVVRSHAPEERAKAQGLNDMAVFASVAASSLTAGWLYQTLGWQAVNLAILPALAAVLAALVLLPRAAQAIPRTG